VLGYVNKENLQFGKKSIIKFTSIHSELTTRQLSSNLSMTTREWLLLVT